MSRNHKYQNNQSNGENDSSRLVKKSSSQERKARKQKLRIECANLQGDLVAEYGDDLLANPKETLRELYLKLGKHNHDDDEIDRSCRACIFERLKDDVNYMKYAICKVGEASCFQYASDSLKGNIEVASCAVLFEGRLLRLCSAELRNDFDLVKDAVEENGKFVEFASDEMKKNEEITMLAVMQNFEAFEFLDYTIPNYEELVFSAVKDQLDALKYVDARFSPVVEAFQETKCELYDFFSEKDTSLWTDPISVELIRILENALVNQEDHISDFKAESFDYNDDMEELEELKSIEPSSIRIIRDVPKSGEFGDSFFSRIDNKKGLFILKIQSEYDKEWLKNENTLRWDKHHPNIALSRSWKEKGTINSRLYDSFSRMRMRDEEDMPVKVKHMMYVLPPEIQSPNSKNFPYGFVISKYRRVTIENYVDSKILNMIELFMIVWGMIEGAYFMHCMKIVNCDIHPGNIVLDRKRLWYIDFGLAMKLDDFVVDESEFHRLFENNELAGCRTYMTPELRDFQKNYESDRRRFPHIDLSTRMSYALAKLILEIMMEKVNVSQTVHDREYWGKLKDLLMSMSLDNLKDRLGFDGVDNAWKRFNGMMTEYFKKIEYPLDFTIIRNYNNR